jgi:hypothetical protein
MICKKIYYAIESVIASKTLKIFALKPLPMPYDLFFFVSDSLTFRFFQITV